MPKKNNPSEHRASPENSEKEIIPLKLITGNWKKVMPDNTARLLIVRAINYCVYRQSLTVKGYLVTDHEVYLILFIEPIMLNRMLMIFYEKLRRDLVKQLPLREWTAHFETEEVLFTETSYETLFMRRNFKDPYMIGLLQGKEVAPPYYDPHFEIINNRLHESDFCSVIDYAGGIGPVVMLDWGNIEC